MCPPYPFHVLLTSGEAAPDLSPASDIARRFSARSHARPPHPLAQPDHLSSLELRSVVQHIPAMLGEELQVARLIFQASDIVLDEVVVKAEKDTLFAHRRPNCRRLRLGYRQCLDHTLNLLS